MSSSFEDSVFNFDCNLLQQSSKNVTMDSKIEKHRKNILIAKRKTIATDTLIRKYYSKKEQLEQVEKYLLASKEECKQVCISYNSTLEKCTQLEKDAKLLCLQTKELQERLNHSENQSQAIQSHANQLQLLVQEYETQIQSLKIENQLEKSNTKENSKKIVSQKNDYDTMLNDLCMLRDVVLGKKKLRKHHKVKLQKYDKLTSKTDDDSTSDCSIDEIDVFDRSTPSPLQTNLLQRNEKIQDLKSCPETNLQKNISTDKRIDSDHDSDSGNEVISEDTGRGSSLACSDLDKCINSPDYFMTNSPFSNLLHKEKKLYIDTSTSPITVQNETYDASTSPVYFANEKNSLDMHKSTKDIGISVHLYEFTNPNLLDKQIKMQDVATSPVRCKQQERATSPIIKNIQERSTSPFVIIQHEKSTSPLTFDDLNPKPQVIATEQECLEINGSNIININNNSDCEVENILSTMRLDCELITPIPKSPAKKRNVGVIEVTEGYVCPDAAKIGDENEKLKADIAGIQKELLSIKSLLKSHLLISNDEVQDPIEDCSSIEMIVSDKRNTSDIENNLQTSKSAEVVHVIESPPDLCAEEIIVLDIQNPLEVDKSIHVVASPNPIENIDENCNNVLPEVTISEDFVIKSPKADKKVKRAKKLTRLEKLRKKLLPRSKIRGVITPPIRKIRRGKHLLFKKTVKETLKTPAPSKMDNKAALEKAVKVLAELKAKETNKSVKAPVLNKAIDKSNFTQEVHIVLSKCDDMIVNSGSTANPSIAKSESALKSPVKCLNLDSSPKKITRENNTTSVLEIDSPVSPKSFRTRSRSKRLSSSLSNNNDAIEKDDSSTPIVMQNDENTNKTNEDRKRLKRVASEKIEMSTKRKLRSSTSSQISNTDESPTNNQYTENYTLLNKVPETIQRRRKSARLSSSQKNESIVNKELDNPKMTTVVTYNDLDIFEEQSSPTKHNRQNSTSGKPIHPKDSILCKMIEKHSKNSVKWNVKKIPDATVNMMCKKLEDGLAHILSVPSHESKAAMNKFVKEIQCCNMNHFLAGLMKYLKDPARKDEMYNKVNVPPAPHMTKSEQVLLFILRELQSLWPSVNFVDLVLNSIEYALFQLNHTPDFGTVESLSHFYAVLCRYYRLKSRLRLFLLDAMYCIQFKSVALIKQCLEVWMHILPLAHMGIAKSPLVICLVYLLHFFKCEDKFNRVQDIRGILSRKYFYQVSEWTQSKVLEMFKNAIMELRDIPIEWKMLRFALIILAKRQGPQWCQKHIIKNMLLPLIEKEDVPERIKEFCLSLFGPLMKPFPNDMKVHCEIIVNQLLEMLDRNVSHRMKEAIFSSLLLMRWHNPIRVTQALLAWSPNKISRDFENLMKDYVKEKPGKTWKTTLSKISLS